MAGRIRDDDVALVRERSPIADVIGEHLPLRSAGGGRLKGLCPFHDEKTPSFNVNPVQGYFHCLAGETRVITATGTQAIRDLAGGVHRVLAASGHWVDAPFYSFGQQPLMRVVVTRDGQQKEIFATAGHRWFVRAGGDRRSQREEVTSSLRPGHRLAHVYPTSKIARTTPSPFGIAHGITFRGGTRSSGGSMVGLCGHKDAQLLKWFPNSFTSQEPGRLTVHHLPAFFKERPPLTESVSYLYGWLAGYFAADGCVASDGTVMLNSARREDLEFVRAVSTRLGIGTFGITRQMREGLPGREQSALFRVHFVNSDLTESFFLIDEHQQRFVRAHKQFSRLGWVVRSVTETERVEEVFCANVEDGHAFVLEDNILTGNCFGCGKGGDVITFVRDIDNLSFAEAIERLAKRAGVELHYEGGGAAPGRQSSLRSRLLEAHAAAQEFYAQQLHGPEAAPARAFLTDRGFDLDAVAPFGCGYAPAGWDVLLGHLLARGFTREELTTGGLVKPTVRGTVIDAFRGRLVWPIRDPLGATIGFNARKLREDDPLAKYVNTAETPIFKKGSVLYGVDLARREIGRQYTAVVVEGVTDVMACHLAGVPTAVATCGTAFGADHVGVLRRLLMDQDEFRGQVVFTFDGDAAGQRAAEKAAAFDQRFVAQTFVAVEPSGLDPCDLRLRHGDAAVRDLIARRVPMFEFAIRSRLAAHDLETAEGRVAGLAAAAPIVTAIKDRSLRPEYARRLAGWLGLEVELVVARLRELGEPAPAAGAAARRPAREEARPLDAAAVAVEREALKIAVQRPVLAGPVFDALEPAVFTAPAHAAVFRVLADLGGTAAAGGGGQGWVDRVRAAAPDDAVRSLVTELAVEPPRSATEVDESYAASQLVRLRELATTREIAALKSRMQRTNPLEAPEDYQRVFGELIALERHKRTLRESAL